MKLQVGKGSPEAQMLEQGAQSSHAMGEMSNLHANEASASQVPGSIKGPILPAGRPGTPNPTELQTS